MAHPDEILMEAANAAFGRGDLAAMADQFFAQNIVWHLAGIGPLAGDYEGVAQVTELLGKISELTGGTAQHDLHDVLVSTDHTVVLATLRGQRAGKQLQVNIVHVIHGSGDGKATEVWSSSSDPAGSAAFWS